MDEGIDVGWTVVKEAEIHPAVCGDQGMDRLQEVSGEPCLAKAPSAFLLPHVLT